MLKFISNVHPLWIKLFPFLQMGGYLHSFVNPLLKLAISSHQGTPDVKDCCVSNINKISTFATI